MGKFFKVLIWEKTKSLVNFCWKQSIQGELENTRTFTYSSISSFWSPWSSSCAHLSEIAFSPTSLVSCHQPSHPLSYFLHPIPLLPKYRRTFFQNTSSKLLSSPGDPFTQGQHRTVPLPLVASLLWLPTEAAIYSCTGCSRIKLWKIAFHIGAL